MNKWTILTAAFLMPLGAWAATASGQPDNPYRTQVYTTVVATSLDQLTWTTNATDMGRDLADMYLIGTGSQSSGDSYTVHPSDNSGIIMSNTTSDSCHGALINDNGGTIKVKLYAKANKQLTGVSGDICKYTGEAASSTYTPKLYVDGNQRVAPGHYHISLTPVRWI